MSEQVKKYSIIDIEQGSDEWLYLRKSKITATDASVIMGVNPWCTPYQRYCEKTTEENQNFSNPAMTRGLYLEPIARELFCIKMGVDVEPKVIANDWQMASLDGLSDCGNYMVEIKCPGQEDHNIALKGSIPDHYYPQLQHQMHVADMQKMYYFSFDGSDGVVVEVVKDPEYLENMIEREKKFYQMMLDMTPPELSEKDYVDREDSLWKQCASRWKNVTDTIKLLEKEEEELRKELISLADNQNTRGGGISLCQVNRKGNVDYAKIPELKNIDLDQYRKPPSQSWRITCA